MSNFYLSQYWLYELAIKSCFIKSILFTINLDTALKLPLEQAKELQKILYINTGIDFKVVKYE